MPPALKTVWLLCEITGDDELNPIEAHKSEDSATAAMELLSSNCEIMEIPLKSDTAAKAKSEDTKDKTAKGKKRTRDDSVVDSEDELAVESPTKTKKTKAVNDARKTVPEGVPNGLKGFKFFFTGTMEKDRKTCEATARKYGAVVSGKIEDADYVVLGAKPGPKKMTAIAVNGLLTIPEAKFFEMVRTGVGKDKLLRKAANAA